MDQMGKNAKNWNTGKKDQTKIGAKKIQDPGLKKKIDAQFIYYLLNQSLDLVKSRICGGTNNNKSVSKEFAQNFKSKAIMLHNSENETSKTKAKLITCCIDSK